MAFVIARGTLARDCCCCFRRKSGTVRLYKAEYALRMTAMASSSPRCTLYLLGLALAVLTLLWCRRRCGTVWVMPGEWLCSAAITGGIRGSTRACSHSLTGPQSYACPTSHGDLPRQRRLNPTPPPHQPCRNRILHITAGAQERSIFALPLHCPYKHLPHRSISP